MANALFMAVLAILAVPVVLFVGIATGPVLLVVLLVAACVAPWALVAGGVSRRARTH